MGIIEQKEQTRFTDVMGRPLTQGLFLEINYDDTAIYTLKEYDHEYKGKVYPSVKRLYLEEEDPTEYDFANKYFLNWSQWKRICDNKVLMAYISTWREELDLKIRARALKEMQALVNSDNGSFQAVKYFLDRGWEKKGAGRPSKADIARKTAVDKRIKDDFDSDVKRLEDYRKKNV